MDRFFCGQAPGSFTRCFTSRPALVGGVEWPGTQSNLGVQPNLSRAANTKEAGHSAPNRIMMVDNALRRLIGDGQQKKNPALLAGFGDEHRNAPKSQSAVELYPTVCKPSSLCSTRSDVVRNVVSSESVSVAFNGRSDPDVPLGRARFMISCILTALAAWNLSTPPTRSDERRELAAVPRIEGDERQLGTRMHKSISRGLLSGIPESPLIQWTQVALRKRNPAVSGAGSELCFQGFQF